MKLICMLKTFKNRYQNTRKYQVKRITNGEIITWKISLKDTSRNKISIGTHTKICQTPKGEDGSKQTKLSTKFHGGTSTKKKRLAVHQHTLKMDHKFSALQKIGQLPHELCIIENLHLNTKCTRQDHHVHYIKENTRQDQENNKILKWHGRQWELTQTWQEIS